MLRSTVRPFVRQRLRARGFDVVRFTSKDSLAGLLHALLNRLEISCVIDVGAHHGEYGRFLRELGYRGRIVSFEPVSDSFAALQRHRRGDRRWFALQYGLGDTDGTTEINVMQNSTLSSFLKPSAYSKEWAARVHGSDDEIVRTETVPVRRLDSVYASCIRGLKRPRVFLKLDTQGWDSKVLAGAASSLPSIPALQTEVSVKPIYVGMTGYTEAITRLNALGFELAGLFPVLQDDMLRVVEFDCVMVRSAGRTM